jgi:hypothetical protein
LKNPVPKVFIGVPCGEFTRSRTAACITALVMSSPVSIGLKWGFAGDVAENQNIFAQQAINTESDYLLLIETDMIFPPDALMRMLAHEKDIVGCLYRHREPPHDIMLWPRGEDVPQGLFYRSAVPSGLMLIHTRVLKDMKCPWFYKFYTNQPNFMVTSDRNFCEKALASGFSAFVDGDLSREVRHIGSTEIPLELPE